MKFLDIPELSSLTSFLTSVELGDRHLRANVEAYSCKQAGEDKKLGKHLEQLYVQEIEQTPSAALGSSPLGALTDPQTRRLLINLICTLNSSYPDYDFSTLKAEQFMKETVGMVVNHVNMTFAEIVESHNKSFLEDLWSAIDRIVPLKDCQVYSYIPDYDNDPFSAAPILWSFNYFFYNKNEKKIVFFACSCLKNKRLDNSRVLDESIFAKEEFVNSHLEEEEDSEDYEFDYDSQETDMEEEYMDTGILQY